MSSLKGWRTHIVSAALFMVGWADLLHGIDIGALLRGIGIPGDKVGAVMVGIAVIMAGMRQITTTAAGKSDKV